MLLNKYFIKPRQGFTLVELLVTIAIMILLVAIAIPNFRALVIDNQLAAQTNNLVSGLSLSRSEAVKRGATVTLCQSSNGADCVTTGGYDQGWIVFLDADQNGARPAVNPDVTEPVIRRFDAMPDPASTTVNVNATDYISYMSTGQVVIQDTGEPDPAISICIADGYQRDISISNGGRISSEKTTTICP